jgi:hypothetical protein
MQDPASIDRYFTEQVVGRPLVVDMGPSDGTSTWPRRGVAVAWLGGAARLTALAGRSLWASDPADALAGQPVNLPGLRRWQYGALVAAGLAWSVALVALTLWWRG